MAWIEKGFDGHGVLRRWFDSRQPPLSIFQKIKPSVAKELSDEDRKMVEELIAEGVRQRHERLKKRTKVSVYSTSTS